MRPSSLSFGLVSALSLVALSCRAQVVSESSRTTATSAAQKADAARRGARGPLPDPVLLDGSTQPPEKRPEYGMLGEFEIPGDENAKPGGKVGGPQNQQGGAAGAQTAADGKNGGGGGGKQTGASGASQAAGTASTDTKAASVQGGDKAGAGDPGGTAGSAAESDAAMKGGPGGGRQGGAGGGGPNDPNATADGIQVAGLSGDASDAVGAAAGGVQKPQQVALGDPTMRIKSAANAPGVVGAVTAGNTQQMETKVGGSGGGGSSSPGGRNSSEKGRVMPAGL